MNISWHSKAKKVASEADEMKLPKLGNEKSSWVTTFESGAGGEGLIRSFSLKTKRGWSFCSCCKQWQWKFSCSAALKVMRDSHGDKEEVSACNPTEDDSKIPQHDTAGLDMSSAGFKCRQCFGLRTHIAWSWTQYWTRERQNVRRFYGNPTFHDTSIEFHWPETSLSAIVPGPL